MQNVLGMHSKYENYHSNSGNNIKPHGEDPASSSLALRTWMPTKQGLPGGLIGRGKCKHLCPTMEQPARLVVRTQPCPCVRTQPCESVSLSGRAQVAHACSLKCWFDGGICCWKKVLAQRLMLLLYVFLRQVGPALTPKPALT